MFRVFSIAILPLVGFTSLATAGPFDSHLSSGVSPTSIVAWAKTVEDYSPTSEVVHLDQFGGGPHDEPVRGLGIANGETVSLGDLDSAAIEAETDPGSITVGFQATIVDGPGADFAVFENASSFFSDPDFVFGELAFVGFDSFE